MASHADAGSMKQLVWYRPPCVSATVEHFKRAADLKPSSKRAVDASEIPPILSLLDRLPLKGEIMVKMSENTPVTKLTLVCKTETFHVVYYNERLKTPDTSFYAKHPPEEAALLKLLR